MPVVGEFHDKFWRARANPVVAPGPATAWQYPRFQAVVIGSLWGVLQGWYEQLAWIVGLVWRLRGRRDHARIAVWLDRLDTLDPERAAVLERVCQTLARPEWALTGALVRACATTPKFHRGEAWVDYSRALKANVGQANNVFRHVKVVQALQAQHPEISNPEAHLLTELAYHGFCATARPHREVVTREILH